MSEELKPMMSQQDADALLAGLASLSPSATFVEYGCGGSTKMWADHMQERQQLHSVEHFKPWFDRVSGALEGHPRRDNIRLHFRPVAFNLTGVFSRPEEELPAGCTDYIHPEIDWSTVDMAFVDGVARGACLAALRARLRPGTLVFLHDYTGRELWYDWAVKLYDRVAVYDLLIEMRVPLL